MPQHVNVNREADLGLGGQPLNVTVQGIGRERSAALAGEVCGYALANKGHDTRSIQDYLGHKAIQHTVRYTELSPTRFKDFWR